MKVGNTVKVKRGIHDPENPKYSLNCMRGRLVEVGTKYVQVEFQPEELKKLCWSLRDLQGITCEETETWTLYRTEVEAV